MDEIAKADLRSRGDRFSRALKSKGEDQDLSPPLLRGSTPQDCPEPLIPLSSSATPFGLALEPVSPPLDHLPHHGEPLSFRSGGFSPPFTLLHACILNPDDSTSSRDEASRSYRTLYYPWREALEDLSPSDVFGG